MSFRFIFHLNFHARSCPTIVFRAILLQFLYNIFFLLFRLICFAWCKSWLSHKKAYKLNARECTHTKWKPNVQNFVYIYFFLQVFIKDEKVNRVEDREIVTPAVVAKGEEVCKTVLYLSAWSKWNKMFMSGKIVVLFCKGTCTTNRLFNTAQQQIWKNRRKKNPPQHKLIQKLKWKKPFVRSMEMM